MKFIAYGTTQKLSETWMPLGEYTKIVMEGLRNGDLYITAGASAMAFKRFETGKLELAEAFQKNRETW